MEAVALACERFRDGWFGQPANSVTSLAFVAAGAAVLAYPGRRRWAYGLLVGSVGAGSWIQHGPHPPWQAYAHDLPLATLLAFVAADSAADLTGRTGLRWCWLATPALIVPAVAAGPVVSSVTQGLLGAVAIGLGLLRARRRPAQRRILLTALGLLAAGSLAGTLTDRTWLCQPDSPVQGHALWHLLAAAALWRLTPVVWTSGHAGVPERVPEAQPT